MLLLDRRETKKRKQEPRPPRRLTEPRAPLTEGKRQAARAGQPLTARGRARAASRARDPERRGPHAASRGRGNRLAKGRRGACSPGEAGRSARPETRRARAGVAPTTSARTSARGRGRAASAGASERAGGSARPLGVPGFGERTRMRRPRPPTATPACAEAPPRPLPPCGWTAPLQHPRPRRASGCGGNTEFLPGGGRLAPRRRPALHRLKAGDATGHLRAMPGRRDRPRQLGARPEARSGLPATFRGARCCGSLQRRHTVHGCPGPVLP